MTETELNLTEAGFTDYAADVKLPAFRFYRGGRPVYTVTPTLEMAMDLLPKPDPRKKFPNNRLLNEPHSAPGAATGRRTRSRGAVRLA